MSLTVYLAFIIRFETWGFRRSGPGAHPLILHQILSFQLALPYLKNAGFDFHESIKYDQLKVFGFFVKCQIKPVVAYLEKKKDAITQGDND